MEENEKSSGVAEIPALRSILPDVKKALSSEEAKSLLHEMLLLNAQHEDICAISDLSDVLPGVFYVDEVFSPSACKALRQEIDNCQYLSFWSASGRDDKNAKRFRNADTIELNSHDLADAIWQKIEPFVSHYSIDVPEVEEGGDSIWERELPGTWRPSGVNEDFLFAKYPTGIVYIDLRFRI